MITQARLEKTLEPAGLDWITALRAPAIRSLVEAGALQLSLFDERDAAEAARSSIVAKAKRSKAADRKALTKRTDDGLPVHSFRSLLGDLATVTRNTMAMDGRPDATFTLYPQLTPVQARAFKIAPQRPTHAHLSLRN